MSELGAEGVFVQADGPVDQLEEAREKRGMAGVNISRIIVEMPVTNWSWWVA
jgi:hypothetical protein